MGTAKAKQPKEHLLGQGGLLRINGRVGAPFWLVLTGGNQKERIGELPGVRMCVVLLLWTYFWFILKGSKMKPRTF